MASGLKVVAASEVHPQPALTYAFNHPGTPVVVGDVRDLGMDVLESIVRESTDKVDLIVGGPPCQGFSTAGKKKANDPRNGLFQEYVRAVEHFRPRMFVLENVPGFKKMHGGRAFKGAHSQLASLGYEIRDALLDASWYGVPQRRQRFIMVGWLPGRAEPFEWPERERAGDSIGGLFAELNEEKSPATVGAALEDIAYLEPGWEANAHQNRAACSYQQSRRSNSGGLLFNHLATKHRAKAVRLFSFIPEGRTISSVPPEERTSKKRTMARLDRNDVSNAVLALPDDLIHYRHDRIPTVREMARLQSFDDDYVIFGKRTSGFKERRVDVPQYTQVGNAVPPLLAVALGRQLARSLGAEAQDLRRLETRREQLRYVVGSSGFAGYLLASGSGDLVDLRDVEGERIHAPEADEGAVSVADSEPLAEWAKRGNPKRGQWAPGVAPRPKPAHVPVEGL